MSWAYKRYHARAKLIDGQSAVYNTRRRYCAQPSKSHGHELFFFSNAHSEMRTKQRGATIAVTDEVLSANFAIRWP